MNPIIKDEPMVVLPIGMDCREPDRITITGRIQHDGTYRVTGMLGPVVMFNQVEMQAADYNRMRIDELTKRN